MKKIWLFALATWIIFSCNTAHKAGNTNINLHKGEEWHLLGFGKNVEKPSQTMKSAFIVFKDNQVNGQSGCNSFFGSYTLDNNIIRFDKVGATKMMCDEPSMLVEDWLHRSLNEANRISTEGNTMKLWKADELLASFELR